MSDISRRAVIQVTGAVGAAILPLTFAPSVAQHHDADKAPSPPLGQAGSRALTGHTTYLFFNSDEAAFIEAAVARLIPTDEQWGGALEAGVPNYIDKQLAGAWGAGERLYRSGPWQPGTPTQGYQLPFTPAELFRTALRAINEDPARRELCGGRSVASGLECPFAKMSPDEQDSYLKTLEAGGKDLGGVPSDVFFSHLWEATLEGFFSDPVYGGNRDMISWRMIGFPGAYASYYDLIEKYGIKIDRPPMSLAENVHGHVHQHPGIPANNPPGIPAGLAPGRTP
jgi:gluconate 2-dehydrogenase gamma chain